MTRAKRARSDFKGGQGRVPRRPMPRVGVVATIRVRGGMEVGVGEGGMVGWCWRWGGCGLTKVYDEKMDCGVFFLEY